MSRSLTLIAAEIAPAIAAAITERSARWPLLARLAGRGSLARLQPTDDSLCLWQTALLDVLGLREHDRYPSAAVARTGDHNERATGFWMQATPMHFAAGLDRLNAEPLHGASRMSEAERVALEPIVAAHLRTANLELVPTATGAWLVRSARPLAIRSATPEAAAANPLDAVMPQGADAAALRRLMTELQMLLHEHPVNFQRARNGLPPINAVWLHGSGAIRAIDRQALPAAFGDDLYVRGIYLLHDMALNSLPADGSALLAQTWMRAVAIVPTEDLDLLERVWLQPLGRALVGGGLAQLEVVLGRWRIQTGRMALLKFWRPQRPPAEWVAC